MHRTFAPATPCPLRSTTWPVATDLIKSPDIWDGEGSGREFLEIAQKQFGLFYIWPFILSLFSKRTYLHTA